MAYKIVRSNKKLTPQEIIWECMPHDLFFKDDAYYAYLAKKG